MTSHSIIRQMLTIAVSLACITSVHATDYYLSPDGRDTNDGLSRRQPLGTMASVLTRLQPGDDVHIMPGLYRIGMNQISRIENGVYAIVFDVDRRGEKGRPIRFLGERDERGQRPVFDFRTIRPTREGEAQGYRVTAMLVSGEYLVFRDLEFVNVQQIRTDHTQSENVRISNGSHNTFYNISCHDGMGIGFYINKKSADNLIVNCDAYNNYDPVSDISPKTGMGYGGNNDGFGCHVQAGCEGNIFIGCRAWNNTDDGYDFINCYSKAEISYSIALRNGYDADDISRGDGNGFKAGGYALRPRLIPLPQTGAPVHSVTHSIAVGNKANGFYANHHLGGVIFTGNTSFDNRQYNYSLVNRKGAAANENYDVEGYGHTLTHNLSVFTSADRHVTMLSAAETTNTIDQNSFSWDGTRWTQDNIQTATTFVSTDTTLLTLPRQSDGMLSTETLRFMAQRQPLGCGFDSAGYHAAIKQAIKQSGARDAGEQTK